MSVDRNDNDLSRFRWKCPAWWSAFMAGREAHRRSAVNERADWQRADWMRAAAWKISEDVA